MCTEKVEVYTGAVHHTAWPLCIIYRGRHIYSKGLFTKYIQNELSCDKIFWADNDDKKTGYELHLNFIISILKENLHSVLVGCKGGTFNNMRDKSHFCRKLDLKICNELWRVQQAQFSKNLVAEISGSIKSGSLKFIHLRSETPGQEFKINILIISRYVMKWCHAKTSKQ